MSEGRCGTCRWWDRERFLIPWGTCQKISYEWPPENQVAAIDGADYDTALSTREDFGCVLWEKPGE
jgi:hypothetical protein